jgi:uncharacterized protein
MAFYKNGVLTGKASVSIYVWMAVLGWAIGIPLAYLRVQALIDYNFNFYEYVKHVPLQFYQLDRVARSLGLLGTIMLLYKSGVFAVAYLWFTFQWICLWLVRRIGALRSI